MAIKFLKAKVVKGEKGYVPVKDQVGGATIEVLLNDTEIYVVDLSILTPEQQKQFQFSGHWQIFNAAGRPYFIQLAENWMEISHIELAAVIDLKPDPELPPEEGVGYEVLSESWVDGRRFITLKKL